MLKIYYKFKEKSTTEKQDFSQHLCLLENQVRRKTDRQPVRERTFPWWAGVIRCWIETKTFHLYSPAGAGTEGPDHQPPDTKPPSAPGKSSGRERRVGEWWGQTETRVLQIMSWGSRERRHLWCSIMSLKDLKTKVYGSGRTKRVVISPSDPLLTEEPVSLLRHWHDSLHSFTICTIDLSKVKYI